MSKGFSPLRKHNKETNDVTSSSKYESASKEGQQTSHIWIKNRRKMYLDSHPSYFDSPDLELADPLLYDRCVRRFQSASEREAEGRAKGYSGVLEADLYRSEAKLEALKSQNYQSGLDGQFLPEDPDEIPADKKEGLNRWKHQMTVRFLNGEDIDFPYSEVDQSEEWDVIENREAEDRWFQEEQPQWVSRGDGPQGETGIQDF